LESGAVVEMAAAPDGFNETKTHLI
jgi:hypothetical protein